MALEDQMEMNFGPTPNPVRGVDPVSGNEIPVGSTAEEVRDDIPANLSEGEMVMAADIVRYYGVKFFEDLRDNAKMAYAKMEADGRIGGQPMIEMEEVDPMDTDMQFDLSELEVTEAPMEAEDAFLGKLFASIREANKKQNEKNRQAAAAKVRERMSAAKQRNSIGKVKAGQAGAPKFRNRAEEMLYNMRNRDKGSSKKKKTSSIDFGFRGNPMERAARKYGSKPEETKNESMRKKPEATKEAGKVKQAYRGGPEKKEETFAERLNFPGFARGGTTGGFGEELGLGGGEYTGGVMEARTYVNDAGHEIVIMFLDGEPITTIPEGYYPKGDSTVVDGGEVSEGATDAAEQSSGGGGGGGSGSSAPTPNPIKYEELSVDELADMVQSQQSMKGDIIAGGMGIINPLLGGVVKFAMYDQAKKTEAEIMRRLEDPSLAIYEREYLESLLEVAQTDKPNLLERLFGKDKAEEVKVEEEEIKEEVETEDLGMADPEPVTVTELTDMDGNPYTPDPEADNAMSTQEIKDMASNAIETSSEPYVPSSYGPEIMSQVEQASKEAAEIAFGTPKSKRSSTASNIQKQRDATKNAGDLARQTFEAFKNDPTNSKAIAENPDAYQRTENVIRDMERGVQRGFEKGGLVDKSEVKEVVKGLEKASKSHSKQAAKLKKALGAKKKTKKSK